MSKRLQLPTKMWAVTWPTVGGVSMPRLHWTKNDALDDLMPNEQVGRVAIVWEPKRKVRRGK